MKKRIFEEEIGEIKGNLIERNLDEFVEEIQNFKVRGATHIDITTAYNSLGYAYLTLLFYKTREETDEEYKKRTKREEEREIQKEKDLKSWLFIEQMRF